MHAYEVISVCSRHTHTHTDTHVHAHAHTHTHTRARALVHGCIMNVRSSTKTLFALFFLSFTSWASCFIIIVVVVIVVVVASFGQSTYYSCTLCKCKENKERTETKKPLTLREELGRLRTHGNDKHARDIFTSGLLSWLVSKAMDTQHSTHSSSSERIIVLPACLPSRE